MTRPSGAVAEHLIGPLLKSVSRSFYLSVRFLPARLREPVGLAYLLARATDTAADTIEIAPELRKSSLEILAQAIQGDSLRAEVNEFRNSLAPLQTNPAERELIE